MLEQLQRVDEGIDLGAGEARVEDDREQAGGLRQSAAQCSCPGEPGSAGCSTGDDLGPPGHQAASCAAGAVLRRVAQRSATAARAAPPRRRWRRRPSPCACASP